MLRLAHQVCRQERGIRRRVRHNENFAGASHHINIYHAVQQLFGRGHKDIAGTDDFIYLGDSLGTVGQSSHRLGTAH